MKSMALLAASVAVLSGTFGIHAEEMAKANVMRVYTDTIAPADQVSYEAGVKTYNKCLAEHGLKFSWTAWSHETGDTYQISYVSDPMSWADFDAMGAQAKACDAVWRSNANPHLKGETSAFIVLQPELSRMATNKDTAQLMGVTFFKLKRGHEAMDAFTAAVKKITAAANKSNWSNHYQTAAVMDGGEGAPDFILTGYATNWADYGKDADPTVWKMVENVYGKDGTAAIRKSLNDAIESTSSHIDRRNADLTYMAPAK